MLKRVNTKMGDNDLVKLMRERRGQILEKPKEPPRDTKKKTSGKKSMYDVFLEKYEDLEKYIDTFKTRDLVYYFRKVSDEAGHPYIVSNIKKDMAIFKRLQENFTPVEICGMIEFLYNSEQDYLDKSRLSPNVLASQWITTIHADYELWLNDRYIPKSSKTKKQKKEWTSTKTETKIGEW